MAAVLHYRLTKKDIFEKAGRFNTLIYRALCRENAAPSQMTIRHGGDVKHTREKIICDFTDAAVLEKLDEHIIPVIQRLLQRAREDDMSAVVQEFSKQALYAVEELGSVSVKDYDEITEILYPRPKVVLGQILAFPARSS